MITLERKPNFDQLLAPVENKEMRHAQQELLKRLFAYFRAVYQVFHIEHPSSHTPIVVWMTQDIISLNNTFQGPIPLLFKFPNEYVVYDYRELNDERAVFESGSKTVLSSPLCELLLQSIDVLTNLIQHIDMRMVELKDQTNITQIVDELKKWECSVGYDKSILVLESARHDNGKALQRLRELYIQYLGEMSH